MTVTCVTQAAAGLEPVRFGMRRDAPLGARGLGRRGDAQANPRLDTTKPEEHAKFR